MSLAYVDPYPHLVQVCSDNFQVLECLLKCRIAYTPDTYFEETVKPILDYQVDCFKSMVAAIGADRQVMDQTSLDYVLYNSHYTNKMFKTYFGGIAEAIHRTIFALGGGPNNSHEPYAEMFIPGVRLPYELVKYHKRLQLLMSNLYMQATVALQDPQCLGFFEHIQRDVVQQRMPGSAAISYIPMSPQPVYQGIGTWYLHDDQNPGNRPPQYSSQSIPQYTPTCSPLSEKTTIYRNTPTQSTKERAPVKPSQFRNRRRKGGRNNRAQSAVPVATREQR